MKKVNKWTARWSRRLLRSRYNQLELFTLFCYWSLFLPYLFNFFVTTVKTNTHTNAFIFTLTLVKPNQRRTLWRLCVLHTHTETPKQKQKQTSRNRYTTQLLTLACREATTNRKQEFKQNKKNNSNNLQSLVSETRMMQHQVFFQNIYIYCKQNSKQTKR